MAFVIEHNLEVNAPAETVWEVITDFPRYGEWNPFVVACETTLKPGEPIDMQVKLLGRPQHQQEIILDCEPGRGFSYRMKPVPPGALSSRRYHRIEALDGNRSRYHSRFELHGWLAPVVQGLLGGRLRTGFSGMSHGIRDRAEALAAGQGRQ